MEDVKFCGPDTKAVTRQASPANVPQKALLGCFTPKRLDADCSQKLLTTGE